MFRLAFVQRVIFTEDASHRSAGVCVSSHLTHTTHTEQVVLMPGTVTLKGNRMLWSPPTPTSTSPSGCKAGEEVIVVVSKLLCEEGIQGPGLGFLGIDFILWIVSVFTFGSRFSIFLV